MTNKSSAIMSRRTNAGAQREFRADRLRILLVEDNPSDAELIERELKRGNINFTSRLVESEEEYINELTNFSPQIILADFSLPQFTAFHALDILKESHLNPGFILVTGSQSEEVAVECIKKGADDYILKQSLKRLSSAVQSVIEKKEAARTKQEAEHRLHLSNRQLRALSAHLQSVREEERTRIAREIHDELGQTLTGLRLDLAWVESKLSRHSTKDVNVVVEQIRTMAGLVDSGIQTVRKIASELRPRVLDDLGLIPALEWQTGEFENRTKIRSVFKTNAEEVALGGERATALFRILQESLTNVARHAGATRVTVTLFVSEKHLTLEINDNGKGIAVKDIPSLKSLGILGMKERAFLLGGEVKIEGRPGRGTTVSVELPA